jgi:para-nitrobenzyl esterase
MQDKGLIIGRRNLLTLGSGLLLTSMLGLPGRAIAGPTALVKTSNGPVRGVVENGVQTFKGLRYGAAPTGGLRFMPPQKPKPWTEVADASHYGAAAMQLNAGGATSKQRPLVDKALHEILLPPDDVRMQKEDCLFLDVWTPQLDGGKRPVMLWMHGGGFNYGSASWRAYDGHNLASKHDVVLVGVNHRLNAYGYLYLGDLDKSGAFATSGNVGQLDLVAALEWIRDNIAAFGGDPGNVTIFGQSGGGGKVSNVLAMPAAKGLFHRAIIESGARIKSLTRDEATKTTTAVFNALGIKPGNTKALQAVPAAKFTAVLNDMQAKTPVQFGPVVDGQALPTHPFDPTAPAVSADIPVIVGCTKDEQSLYNTGQDWWGKINEADALAKARATAGVGDKADALFKAFKKLRPGDNPSYLFNDTTSAAGAFISSVRLAERKADYKRAPAYHYVFQWGSPADGGIMRAPHTMEIPFVFDNIDKAPTYVGNAPSTRALADLTSQTWVQFAKTGDPNHAGLPHWPAYDTKTRPSMAFNVQSKVMNDLEGEVRRILEG